MDAGAVRRHGDPATPEVEQLVCEIDDLEPVSAPKRRDPIEVAPRYHTRSGWGLERPRYAREMMLVEMEIADPNGEVTVESQRMPCPIRSYPQEPADSPPASLLADPSIRFSRLTASGHKGETPQTGR